MKKKRRAPTEVMTLPDGPVNVVQVAAFTQQSYQTARNQMLSGRFGPSVYNAASRALTVDGARVRKLYARALTPDPAASG